MEIENDRVSTNPFSNSETPLELESEEDEEDSDENPGVGEKSLSVITALTHEIGIELSDLSNSVEVPLSVDAEENEENDSTGTVELSRNVTLINGGNSQTVKEETNEGSPVHLGADLDDSQ